MAVRALRDWHPAPCEAPTLPVADRRFEAAIFELEIAVRECGCARELHTLVEELCSQGFDIAVVSSRRLGDVDGELAVRPAGAGRLYLVVDRRSELFAVGRDGPELLERRAPTDGRLTDDAECVRWIVEQLWRDGIAGEDILLLAGDTCVSAALEDQLRRRESGELPRLGVEPDWVVTVEGFDRTLERVHEAQLTLADGRIGTSATPLVGDTVTSPRVFAGGIYDDEGAESHLLSCPVWSRLDGEGTPPQPLMRALDLRTGLLFEEAGDRLHSVRFSSVARPGVAALRVEEHGGRRRSAPLLVPPRRRKVRSGRTGGSRWTVVAGTRGGVAAAAAETIRDGAPRRLERLAAYACDVDRIPTPADAVEKLQAAEEIGFEGLLREHRRAWARRWDAADVQIEGDAGLQRDVRFGLFHLLASVGETGETALGARGVSGPGYRGHVFWDTDVFVLPFLAATRPEAARALLEYRVRRLPAARAAARRLGRAGARFPWESARTGREATPSHAHLRSGEVIPIRTGELEEHIVADVAWGAACYLDWTGDEDFLRTAGRDLLVDTARYWASRIRVDDEGHGHIDGVIGPDEYHETVDDNAFTNVMAQWNLRRAAALLPVADEPERASWLELADALVDGYDEETGLYEQFAGFFGLEPLVIEELAPRRPVAAELLLGRERLRTSQVVKQADVLMLHHLVPDEVAPGSLVPNLEFYEPRTAHGSSLSPGIHASLFARAGLLEQAVEALRLTSRIDLDDLTQTTAAGLHLAAMGSVWQALAFGFAGLRPDRDSLRVDPRLPLAWRTLALRVRFRGIPLIVRIERDALVLTAESPLRVRVGARRTPVVVPASHAVRMARRGTSWEEVES